MTDKNYLLIIDKHPFDSTFCDYFAKFNFEIRQYSELPTLDLQSNLPAAIIVDYDIISTSKLTVGDLYNRYPVPLVIISDHHHCDKCVEMLDEGADDFIKKPIHPRELHARITVIGKRVLKSTQGTEHEKEILHFANYKLYTSSRQLFTEGKELMLSANEYELLLAFVRQPQQPLNRDFLLQVTSSHSTNTMDRRIDVQISRLRQKIENNPKRPEFIKTIRNEGYMFTAKVFAKKM
ncbi:MAG: winged helix-turn-helix domain-containing protein [Legionella sp.]